jgi:hypothetical protein
VGAVDFGRRDGDYHEVETQTDDSMFMRDDTGNQGQRRRKKLSHGGGDGERESPIERMLRLSRHNKLKLEGEGRIVPPRIVRTRPHGCATATRRVPGSLRAGVHTRQARVARAWRRDTRSRGAHAQCMVLVRSGVRRLRVR